MSAPKEERTVEIVVNGQKANASLKEMSAAAAVLSNQVAKIAADDPKRGELIAQLQQLKQRIADTRNEVAGLTQSQAQLAAAQAAAVAEQQRAIATGQASTASFNEMRTAAGLLEKQLHEMSADDPGRAALIADYQRLKTRMGEARAEMEQSTKSEAQLRAEHEALRTAQVQLVVNGQKVTASMREMREAAAQLEKELDELAHDDPARGPLIKGLQEMRARIRDVQKEVAGVEETAGRMKQVMTNAFAFAVGGGIEAAVEKVFSLGRSIFDTTAKFETYSAVMKNALGSESAAQKALGDIQQMAAKTPFSVDELTGSFIKFVNRGLQPSMAEMTKMADIAASQGKSFDQLTEAVLDAAGGEFERLKEFGIKASKSGDEVSLSFKGVNQTVANTPEAINAAILAFGELKGVAGSTAAISETMEGQLSNLGDTADQVAIEFGQGLRPVFVAILSTLGFFLGVLRELPRFIVENRGLLLGLGVAVATLNGASLAATASTLAHIAAEKARAIAARATAAAQWLLNAAMTANPIGLVVAAVALLVGGFVTLYEKSEQVRAAVAGLSAVFKQVFLNIAQSAAEHLTGLGELILGVATFDVGKIKSGGEKLINSFRALGTGVADAYQKGYDGKLAEEAAARTQKAEEEGKKQGEANAKGRAAAEAKARMEALKNEEAALRERLAKAREGSEAEMRLKQQLVTNEAKQKLLDEKKTEADRRIVLAEAEQQRVKLAQEFYEKRQKEAKSAREKQEAAEAKASRAHGEMLLNLEEAALIARGDKRETELGQILLDAKRKALAVTGTEREKNAAVELIMAEAYQKQVDLRAKFNEEDLKQREEFVNEQIEGIEEDEARKQAAFEVMLEAGLTSAAEYEQASYEARRNALDDELALVEKSLGQESKQYKKVRAEQLKNEKDHEKAVLDEKKKSAAAKRQLTDLELRTAGDVLQTTLGLLFADEEARRKHHGVYVALSAAKILMDGAQEVAAIWRYSAENPYNGPTAGTAGAVMGAIQTALAVARTMGALNQLNGVGAGFAKGGPTGGGLVVSPLGQLLEMSGMRVGGDGRLRDDSGFAVAGVVHEDEYVVPKWQLENPQDAAVVQWLEARRLRGFADGSYTTPAAPGGLPAAVAAAGSDPAVLQLMLEELRAMNRGLAEVRTWQSRLQVVLDPTGVDRTLTERKQIKLEASIRA